MNITIAIQPLGIRAEELAAIFGSASVTQEILDHRYLQPIRKTKGLTIYDAGDCARAWVEWCEQERKREVL